VFNRRFSVVGTKGGATFRRGIVQFAAEPYTRALERFYRTSFLAFACRAQTYANCDTNLAAAARRLTASRFSKSIFRSHPDWTEDEKEDAAARYEAEYTLNQESFVESHSTLWAYIRSKLALATLEYKGKVEENRLHYADPHAKRMPRIHATLELYENGKIYQDNWMEEDRRGRAKLPYQVKPKEHAKPGKLPRGIGNLGVHASLAGYWLTGLLKNELARESLWWGGSEFIFIKSPTTHALDDLFEKFATCKGFTFCYHSDDSALTYTIDGQTRRYNIDITSCDSSHRANGVFKAIEACTPDVAKDDMLTLVKQLQALVSVGNRSRRQAVKLRTTDGGAFLASGSTLTTFLNNIASLCIGVAIHEGGRNDPEGIIAAAKRAGYIITLEEVIDFHGLQFLKNSPVLIDGRWRALQNVGVLTRLSGQCPGDLPGRGDLTARALHFQRSLLAGTYPNTRFGMIDRMREANAIESWERDIAPTTTLQQRDIDREVGKLTAFRANDRSELLVVPDDEAYARYTRPCLLTIDPLLPHPVPNPTCTQADLDQLHSDLTIARIGDVIANHATHVFLQMDYGMDAFVGDSDYREPHYVREPTTNV